MKAEIIERTERRRYRLMLWHAITFTLFFGGLIFSGFEVGRVVAVFRAVVIIVGVAGYLFISYRLNGLNAEIRTTPFLKEALGNEYYMSLCGKSFTCAYWATLIAIGVFFILPLFFNIPLQTACLVLLLVGVLSWQVAWLAYNRC